MLAARLGFQPMKGFMLRPTMRNFASATSIQDRFQEAWIEKNQQSGQTTQTKKAEVNWNPDFLRMKKGYQHPYHTKKYPLFFSSALDLHANISEAAGPEQVSPHYETLSRSRRGIIFLFAYIGTIVTVAQLGGWAHNEWIRGLIFHHEFLLAFFVGYSELRHFFWLPGPKFSVFYDVFNRYEYSQLISQWNDIAEERCHKHLEYTKEQLEYNRIHNEYRFIKKRALLNYLTNSRLNLEKHFHDRAVAMLNNVQNFETQNLSTQLKDVAQSAF